MRDWIIGVPSVIIGLYLFFSIPLWLLKRKFRNKLEKMSLKELKQVTFEEKEAYFNYLSQDNPIVKRFRQLIRSEDIENLIKEWPKISRQLVDLERKNGHTGRPLILDYYGWYEIALSVLDKKIKNQGSGQK